MKTPSLLTSAAVFGTRLPALVGAWSSHSQRSSGGGARLRSSTIDAETISQLEHLIADLQQADDGEDRGASPGRGARAAVSMGAAGAAQGMPWTTTVGRSAEADPLLYMPFWEWQFEFMTSSLTNLHPVECAARELDVSYNENKEKCARIVNQCYASDEYRKIRMTYYDAGDAVQVFNSVWYPDAGYDLPVLGIDLLSFNRKKYLAIVDFQPLHDAEEGHAATFEHLLAPIRDRYARLKGKMSSRFYDETQFFSKEMLFARFEDGAVVQEDLFPAFQDYVRTHLELVRGTSPVTDPDDVRRVFDRHRAYDTYSAERDPAAGLFTAMFGKEWAEDFIHGFLFSLSERKGEGLTTNPPVFGGAPQRGGHGNPSSQIR